MSTFPPFDEALSQLQQLIAANTRPRGSLAWLRRSDVVLDGQTVLIHGTPNEPVATVYARAIETGAVGIQLLALGAIDDTLYCSLIAVHTWQAAEERTIFGLRLGVLEPEMQLRRVDDAVWLERERAQTDEERGFLDDVFYDNP